MSIFKPISISLSPNVQSDDVWLSFGLLLSPFTWTQGNKIKKLENLFKGYLKAKYAISFNSGRTCLFSIVRALELKKGDEVLLQAFTCNAVPNPILWAGITPIYVDVNESLNIDPVDLEKKITPRSRAVVIQHTLGVPAQIDAILEVARRHNLILIEDCAHSLGATYNNNLVGTFGDVAFFSFGRDKVISSVWGGMATTNNVEIGKKLRVLQESYPLSSPKWVIRQLLHPILFSIIIPTYYIFGKYFLILLKAVRGVGLAVSKKERKGEKPDMFPARMPNALAMLAIHQFNKLEKYNTHRRKIAKLYAKELKEETSLSLPAHIEGAIYLRFNVLHPKARKIIKHARQKHIILGDWYNNIIDPTGTVFEKMRYIRRSCPNAERAARESVNLPTHIGISENAAKKIVQYIQNFR